MAQETFLDKVRDWLGGLAFSIFLWSIRMTQDQYIDAIIAESKPTPLNKQLLKDMVLGIDLALEKIPDECDCQADYEYDTNATIHQEEVCQIFSRYHLEAVKTDIEKILSAEQAQ